MVKIAFHIDQLDIRGTGVALFDYANFNEKLLGNESVIIVPQATVNKSHSQALQKFTHRFQKVLAYKDLETVLEEEKCDLLYCIKYGKNDGVFSKKVKTVVHCVFDLSEPHGDIYAGVSEALVKKFNKELFVPHMVSLPPSKTKEHLRKQFNIPEDAVVFGRYGGADTMNLQFCWEVIGHLVQKRKDFYFLFINTPQIVKHPRVLYLPTITTENDKNLFINTCDAYLECGNLGHSFGLAIGEFSVNNKPIIAYKGPNMWNTAHFDILGDKGIYFSNAVEFYKILESFNPDDYKDKDLNCYRDYSPEQVMKIFDDIFLEEMKVVKLTKK